MNKILNGWHAAAHRINSPNCDARPHGCQIELLVIHGISVPLGQFGGSGIAELFTNQTTIASLTSLRVSAHFLLRRDGNLIQFLNCNMRAWHAGTSTWAGRTACNDFSIGIELEGTDTQLYCDTQYVALANLIRELMHAYPNVQFIAGHCHIAPHRKTDPGDCFDWQRLFAEVGPNLDGRFPSH